METDLVQTQLLKCLSGAIVSSPEGLTEAELAERTGLFARQVRAVLPELSARGYIETASLDKKLGQIRLFRITASGIEVATKVGAAPTANVGVRRINMTQDSLRAELRQGLVDYFNEEEIRTLCFDMRLDYESLPAQGKAGKAREVVAYFERINGIPSLVEQCRRLRPNGPWHDMPEMAIGVSMPPDGRAPEELSTYLARPPLKEPSIADTAMDTTLPTVFVSYSHIDEDAKERLLVQLGVLQKVGLIRLWSDDRIRAGADWEAEINQAIAQAKVGILLISAHFLTSEFILSREVPALLQRREREGLVIFPVITKPCAWQRIPWLARMNVRPKNGRPVWSDGGSHIDEDLAAIADEVALIIERGNAVS